MFRDTLNGAFAAKSVPQKREGGWGIKDAVLRAYKAAALTFSVLGAQEGIPWAEQIDAFV